MSIPTSTTIAVYAAPDYHFTATASEDEVAVRYYEDLGVRTLRTEMTFAGPDEMIAVATAMIRAAKAHKEQQ